MRIAVRVLVSVLAVWFLTGCASMRAYQAEQAKWQGLADQATTQLRAASVTVHVTAGRHGVYTCAARRIDLGTDAPAANVRFLLAHELGHHVHNDCTEGIAAQEHAANATAVQILQVWGLTETRAAKEVAGMLWLLAKERTVQGRGHDACAELVAILRAYPVLTLTNPTDGTCAAELAAKAGG
jgi:hypothetical protein